MQLKSKCSSFIQGATIFLQLALIFCQNNVVLMKLAVFSQLKLDQAEIYSKRHS